MCNYYVYDFVFVCLKMILLPKDADSASCVRGLTGICNREEDVESHPKPPSNRPVVSSPTRVGLPSTVKSTQSRKQPAQEETSSKNHPAKEENPTDKDTGAHPEPLSAATQTTSPGKQSAQQGTSSDDPGPRPYFYRTPDGDYIHTESKDPKYLVLGPVRRDGLPSKH